MAEDPLAGDGVVGVEAAFSASPSAGIFGRILPFASSASRAPSRSPAISASTIARPD